MILGVNVDHVATLRNARGGTEPDPVMAATLAILGGADGITVHLREDRRHIIDRDLEMLKAFVPVELNLEMAATDEMVRIAIKTKPDMVTIVPERRQELTTEGGLALKPPMKALKKAVSRLHDKGIDVSLFVNPVPRDMYAAAETGADMVELHTGYYANARGEKAGAELERVRQALKAAHDSGLTVNAGHGLNYINVRPVAALDGVRGLYIGHSIVSRAVLVGMERAVREMKDLISAEER